MAPVVVNVILIPGRLYVVAQRSTQNSVAWSVVALAFLGALFHPLRPLSFTRPRELSVTVPAALTGEVFHFTPFAHGELDGLDINLVLVCRLIGSTDSIG